MTKDTIKAFVHSHYYLNRAAAWYFHMRRRGHLHIENHGHVSGRRYVEGKDNSLVIGRGTILDNVSIRIIGNGNRLIFGERCTAINRTSFWLIGNGNTITIGDDTTIGSENHLIVQEHDTSITIGRDCMIANTVIIRTSDSHPIYDRDSHERLNPAASVVIGDHVWLAPTCRIFKGTHIGDGAVVASHAIVTHDVPPHTIVAGTPARVTKENIEWTREDINK